jgi:magnesium transporter
MVDNFFPVAYKIERNVQEIEDSIFSNTGRKAVEEISLMRRDIIAYRRIVKPLLPVIARLEFIKGRLIGDELEVYFSDIGDALARIWDTLEDQKGIIEALNDTYNSLTSHKTNEVIRALTVISVIMLPLTLVSGIYGMNVALPFDKHPLAFEFVLGLMGAVAVGMVATFRRKEWL